MKASILTISLIVFAAAAHNALATPSLSAAELDRDVVAGRARTSDWLGEIQPPTQVNERIWRSGRPTEQHLQELWARGVRVIIDLEQDADVIQAESAIARRIGFEFHSYPTDSFWSPDDVKMNEILEILRSSPTPVLVHCYHGEDRTGLVIGLERVLIENWPASRAYAEMLERGFHRVLLGLESYFRSKTSGR